MDSTTNKLATEWSYGDGQVNTLPSSFYSVCQASHDVSILSILTLLGIDATSVLHYLISLASVVYNCWHSPAVRIAAEVMEWWIRMLLPFHLELLRQFLPYCTIKTTTESSLYFWVMWLSRLNCCRSSCEYVMVLALQSILRQIHFHFLLGCTFELVGKRSQRTRIYCPVISLDCILFKCRDERYAELFACVILTDTQFDILPSCESKVWTEVRCILDDYCYFSW